jgi:hypothetical protein
LVQKRLFLIGVVLFLILGMATALGSVLWFTKVKEELSVVFVGVEKDKMTVALKIRETDLVKIRSGQTVWLQMRRPLEKGYLTVSGTIPEGGISSASHSDGIAKITVQVDSEALSAQSRQALLNSDHDQVALIVRTRPALALILSRELS